MPSLLRWPLALLLLPTLGIAALLVNCAQMLSLVIAPLSPVLFRRVNRTLCDQWFLLLRLSLEVWLGVEIRQSGDTLPWKENAVLVSNHQAMSDIPALICVAHRSGRKGDLKWFVKDPLKWVPGIGWGMQFLDCLFVKRNWTADKEKVTATFEKLRTHRSPFWVTSFLEGTRATPKKLARSREFAQKSNLPVLQHVMLPRTKGFEATLEGLAGINQAIYIATIGYEKKPPNLLQLFFGPVKCIHVHTQRYSDWPTEKEARSAWIIARYQEMDERLKTFHQRGSF